MPRLGRRSSLPFCLLLAVPANGQVPAPGDREWVDAARGFRIGLPADWQFGPLNDAATGFTLQLVPRDGPPGVGARVSIAVARERDGDEVLRLALAQIEGGGEYANTERITRRLRDRDVVGLRTEMRAKDGEIYRLEQLYLVADGRRFILQSHAPKGEAARFAEDFEALWSSFEVQSLDVAAGARWRQRALASRCGSEVAWTKSWAQASRLADAARKLVLVVVRSYPGYDLPDETSSGAFMDADVVELIGERCVALRLDQDMPAPFREHDSYGMSRTTFGFGILLVAPDGKVLHETHATHPDAVYAFLRENVVRHPEYGGVTVGQDGTPLSRAARHLARGELAAAAPLLADVSSAEGYRLRASLHRRLHRGEEALRDLRNASDAGGDRVALALETANVQLRLGRDEAARRTLAGVAGGDLGEHAGALLFWQGVCALRAGDSAAAVQAWQRLCAEHGDDRHAWKAAALLENFGSLGGQLRTEWPDPAILASLRTPSPASDFDDVERRAVDALLTDQREDGSWICPSELNLPARLRPNAFVDAITAIGGAALLQRRADPRCDRAAAAALGYVLRTHERAKEHAAPRSYMDYSVWSEAFMLRFLADCLQAGFGDGERLRTTAAELIDHLASKQKPGGGWSYYVTHDLQDGGEDATLSFSFVTAAVLVALLRAEQVGLAVPATVREAGLDCLETMRSTNGAFAYAWQPGADASVRATRPAGAAGRGPLCEWALLLGGRGSVERIGTALATFRDLRGDYARQLGKVLMHAGPDGEGCHYLMFDYAFAAAALRALPPEQRAAHRSWLLELLGAARSVEGGFRDTPINGWAFGTAMALQALHDLAATD